MTYPATDTVAAVLRDLLAADIDLNDTAIMEPRAGIQAGDLEAVEHRRQRAMTRARGLLRTMGYSHV